jgi:hypothetical protein
MSTTRNLKLARFLKTLLDILLGLTVILLLALVLWVALYPRSLDEGDGFFAVTIPVTIGRENDSQINLSFTSNSKDVSENVSIIEAEGTLRFGTSDSFFILIANAAKIIGGIGLAVIFYLLRGVVKAILEGDPFSAENGRRIRHLGYAVLLVSILWQAVHYLAANEILRRLPQIKPTLYPGPTFEAGIILVSLLILLMAQVWSYGLDIERERALTI